MSFNNYDGYCYWFVEAESPLVAQAVLELSLPASASQYWDYRCEPPCQAKRQGILPSVAEWPVCHQARHWLFPPGPTQHSSPSEAPRLMAGASVWRGAKGYICRRGNFPSCILPKHLTRIKVSPGAPISHIETKLFSFL